MERSILCRPCLIPVWQVGLGLLLAFATGLILGKLGALVLLPLVAEGRARAGAVATWGPLWITVVALGQAFGPC